MPRGIPLKKRVAKKTKTVPKAASRTAVHVDQQDYKEEYERLIVEHKMLHEYRMKQDRRIAELEDKLVVFTDQEQHSSYVGQPANSRQIGGDHYRRCRIQPWDFICANGIGFMEGTIISYLTRWEDKGGIQDLRKCQHYLDKMVENETQKLIIKENFRAANQAANEVIGGVLNSLNQVGIGRGT